MRKGRRKKHAKHCNYFVAKVWGKKRRKSTFKLMKYKVPHVASLWDGPLHFWGAFICRKLQTLYNRDKGQFFSVEVSSHLSLHPHLCVCHLIWNCKQRQRFHRVWVLSVSPKPCTQGLHSPFCVVEMASGGLALVCELELLRSLQFQTTVDSVGNDCALNVSCRPQQAGLMLVAGVGVLACITARRGFLIDALGKQLVGFMFPNQSVRSKQGVQRYWLISWSQRTLFSDKNVSKLSGNRCHVTGRSRRDRNLLFDLVKGNNFTYLPPGDVPGAGCMQKNTGQAHSAAPFSGSYGSESGQPSDVVLAVATKSELKGASIQLFLLFFTFAREDKTWRSCVVGLIVNASFFIAKGNCCKTSVQKFPHYHLK